MIVMIIIIFVIYIYTHKFMNLQFMGIHPGNMVHSIHQAKENSSFQDISGKDFVGPAASSVENELVTVMTDLENPHVPCNYNPI